MSTLAEALEHAIATGLVAPEPSVTEVEAAALADVERWLATGTELDALSVWWLLSVARRLPVRTSAQGGAR